MGLKNLMCRLLLGRDLMNSLEEYTKDQRVNRVTSPHGEIERDNRTLTKTFVVCEAMNGSYIQFTKHKYNPNGPDDHRHEVYIVQPGEALIDAISTVLVLTEK